MITFSIAQIQKAMKDAGVGENLTRYTIAELLKIEPYKPQYLSWCKSYVQEETELRELIEGNPEDVKLLKQEYQQLTGKQYKAQKGN